MPHELKERVTTSRCAGSCVELQIRPRGRLTGHAGLPRRTLFSCEAEGDPVTMGVVPHVAPLYIAAEMIRRSIACGVFVSRTWRRPVSPWRPGGIAASRRFT